LPKRVTVAKAAELPATVAQIGPGNYPGNLRGNYDGNWPGNLHGNRPGNRMYSKAEAEADLVTRLALEETIPSQDALVRLWGVNKGTVSRWVVDWERRQLIPARQQIGRCKQLQQA